MKRFNIAYTSIFFIIVLAGITADAQENPTYGKNAVSFNITRSAINELSMSYEHWLSFRKSIEFTGGYIYVNEFLKDQFNDWKNATFFSEQGYSFGLHYKIFRRVENETKWHDYISFGVSYKYLYYDNLEVISDVKFDSSLYKINSALYKDSIFQYNEHFLRDSKRNKFSLDFVWGHVYEMNKTFAFEFYYGASIVGTIANHTDHNRQSVYVKSAHQWISKPIPDYSYDQFYMRPALLLGIKFRIRF
jgi:hypothetical protein